MILRRIFGRKNKPPKEKKRRIKKLKEKIIRFYLDKKSKIQTSLRLELLAVTLICLMISVFSFNLLNDFLKNKISRHTYITYNEDRISEENNVRQLLSSLMDISSKNPEDIYNDNKERINELIENLKSNFTSSHIEEILSIYGVVNYNGNNNGNNNEYYIKDMQQILSKSIKGNESMEKIIKSIEEYVSSEKVLNQKIGRQILNNDANVFLTDLEGNVKFSSSETYSEKINIYSVIGKMSRTRVNNFQYNGEAYDNGSDNKTFYSFYPITINKDNYYLIYEKNLHGTEKVTYTGTSAFFSAIVSFIIFILVFLTITKKKIEYIEYISNSLREISKGDLEYNVEVKGYDELAILASDINYMEREIKEKIENERLAEKTKSELITNVSHDLRTPLTSVMGYMGLVKDKKYSSEEEREEYLNIAYNKAEKLKILIEDLFQYTKMNNQGLSLDKREIDINELIRQLIMELSPTAEEKNIEFLDNMGNKRVIINVDGDKISRVFENILSNAVKYSPSGEKISILCEDTSVSTIITVENLCGNGITKEELDKIFERFYRGDKSRNSDTGGSGLGLAIAKSIVDMHGGDIWANLNGDMVSFNVRLYKK
ncbi:sensor histidine kinase [Hathewaya massiliensis]|uniref:sensor histidine kinase n=1 Tax=Hathewaya massiliensis TaxID=1964382 RepID=UPI00115A28B9|nr:HAMP domain-containing sensor histidine kinase [Hathewaya massiliensis]